jgi:cytochrome c-type biogenesis protein CcmF
LGRTIQVDPTFYNNALIPIGLALLGATAVVPLLRWGDGPSLRQQQLLLACGLVSLLALGLAMMAGVRHPIWLAVVSLSTLACSTFVTAIVVDGLRRQQDRAGWEWLQALRSGRRQYAGYVVHLGFVCVAIGITGSSLGTRRNEFLVAEGDVVWWADRQIRYAQLDQRELPDKLVAEAVLEISHGGREFTLRPARHLHLLQNEWTTEVAIDSTWRGDFFTILNAGLGDGRVALTFVENPMMRWIWLGAAVSAAGAIAALLPANDRRAGSQTARKKADDEPVHPMQPPAMKAA